MATVNCLVSKEISSYVFRRKRKKKQAWNKYKVSKLNMTGFVCLFVRGNYPFKLFAIVISSPARRSSIRKTNPTDLKGARPAV